MKARPILFSAPMVRALLAGTKTQTRRVVKPLPITLNRDTNSLEVDDENIANGRFAKQVPCPYGQPGDRLWVREAFDFLPAGGPDEPQACVIVYWATGSTEPRCAPESYNPMIYGHEKVRPSIHMPRWASRITLEVTHVRVERLQDISRSDAMAEGIDKESLASYKRAGVDRPAGFAYREIWESINGPGSWDANPWVWVVEFKPVAPPVRHLSNRKRKGILT